MARGGGVMTLCMSMLPAIVSLLAGQRASSSGNMLISGVCHVLLPLSEATWRWRYVSSRLNTLKSYCCLVGRPCGISASRPQSRRVTQGRRGNGGPAKCDII